MKHLKIFITILISLFLPILTYADNNSNDNAIIFDKCGLTITRGKSTLQDSASANWNLKKGKNGNSLWVSKNPQVCGEEVELSRDSLGNLLGVRILHGSENELRFNNKIVTIKREFFDRQVTGGVTSEMCKKAQSIPLKECSKKIRSLGIGRVDISDVELNLFLSSSQDEVDTRYTKSKSKNANFNTDLYDALDEVIKHCAVLETFQKVEDTNMTPTINKSREAKTIGQ